MTSRSYDPADSLFSVRRASPNTVRTGPSAQSEMKVNQRGSRDSRSTIGSISKKVRRSSARL